MADKEILSRNTAGERNMTSPGLYTDRQTIHDSDVRIDAPSYRHAQRQAEKYGDYNTYFMRRTARKSKRGKGRS
jgi:hypothetical protein